MDFQDLQNKVGIIIQARTGSTRFPKKVLERIDNKTILEILLDRLKKIQYINKIVATTNKYNDRQIIKIAKKNNFQTFKGSENNVLKRYYDCARQYNLKIIIRITSDCPLIDPFLIVKMLKKFKLKNLDYYSNTVPIEKSTYPNGSDIEIFTYKALKKSYLNCFQQSDKEHVTNFFLKKKVYFKNVILKSVENMSNYRYTLDYPKDLKIIKLLYSEIKKNNVIGTTKELVNILNKNNGKI